MNKPYQLEICANSVASALAAQEGGADRVEFCQHLAAGGITPSHGQLVLARRLVNIGIHVLIRPRTGNFLYTDLEVEEMKADIAFCKETGADGVVIGLLQADGRVDTDRTAELVALARPMHVTFHRAFDVCRDPFEALERIIACGCGRLLTSGMEQTAVAGANLIGQLVDRAGGRIAIMPGSGIDAANITQLVNTTNANAFHASAKVTLPDGMTYTNDAVSGMGDAVWVSSKQKIRQLADTLQRL